MIDELTTAIREWVALPGWSPESKMRGLIDCVLADKPQICVDVGTYSGRALMPVAWALKKNGSGHVLGIDPYSNAACVEGWPEGQEHSGWDCNSLLPYYQKALDAIKRFGVGQYASIFVEKSLNAVTQFGDATIDLIHIDGNHSEASALADVTAWLPKMKPGSHLWMDDVGWESTQKAVAFLDANCDVVRVYEDIVAGQPWFTHYRVRK